MEKKVVNRGEEPARPPKTAGDAQNEAERRMVDLEEGLRWGLASRSTSTSVEDFRWIRDNVARWLADADATLKEHARAMHQHETDWASVPGATAEDRGRRVLFASPGQPWDPRAFEPVDEEQYGPRRYTSINDPLIDPRLWTAP